MSDDWTLAITELRMLGSKQVAHRMYIDETVISDILESGTCVDEDIQRRLLKFIKRKDELAQRYVNIDPNDIDSIDWENLNWEVVIP